jgi:hypothetical protein
VRTTPVLCAAEYSDCALRLACLAGRRGDFPEAKKWVDRAMQIQPAQKDAQALLGKLPSPSHPLKLFGHACHKGLVLLHAPNKAAV